MDTTRLKRRLDKVCHYIGENLEQPIRLEQLARVAHCSPYHFQRIFKAHIGTSPAQYIQNARLRRAMLQLANRPTMSITDIAFDAGFDFPESFTHAFKKRFGVTPTKFRNYPNWELWNNFIQQGKPHHMKTPNQTDYNVELVNFPETPVAALEHIGSPHRIMESVETFIGWRRENKISPPHSATYNIFYNDPDVSNPDEFHMDLCCSTDQHISPNQQGVIEKTIPANTCAKVRYQGPEQGIRHVMDHLYRVWLQTSAYESADDPPFLERITFFPDVKEHEAVTDIYLPLKTSTG